MIEVSLKLKAVNVAEKIKKAAAIKSILCILILENSGRGERWHLVHNQQHKIIFQDCHSVLVVFIVLSL